MCIRDRRYLVREFERMCGQKGLKINPGKSKVLVFEEEESVEEEVLEVRVGGVVLEEVKVFRYLGMELGLSLIHISEPTRLLSISYAVFCLKKKKKKRKIK